MTTTKEIIMGTCECAGCPHCRALIACADIALPYDTVCADCNAQARMLAPQPAVWPRCPYCRQALTDHISQKQMICAQCERDRYQIDRVG